MTKKVRPLPMKREAYPAILRFMTEGDVTLKNNEQLILDRWIAVDAYLRAKELSEEEIIKKIAETFDVSVFTARNDIAHAQRLFSDSRKLNKKYLIHIHLDRIDKDIEAIRNQLFTHTDENGQIKPKIPDAKQMAAYSKLLETYTYTLNSIPEDQRKDKTPPPIFHFIMAPGQTVNSDMNASDALAKADEILMKQNQTGTYVQIEDDTEEE